MHDTSGNKRDGERRARIEAQNALQWLARLARSYGVASDDDIRLDFERATHRVLTPEVAPGIRLGLTLPTLILQFEEKGRATPHPLDVDEKSSTEVEAWLLAELLHRGFDRDRFSKRLPYEWPHMMSGDEVKYAPRDLAGELDRLTRELDDAADLLVEVRRGLAAGPDDARRDAAGRSGLSCWPDLFAIGFPVPRRAGPLEVAFVAGEQDGRSVYRVTGGAPERARIELVAGSAADAVIVARLVEAASA